MSEVLFKFGIVYIFSFVLQINSVDIAAEILYQGIAHHVIRFTYDIVQCCN